LKILSFFKNDIFFEIRTIYAAICRQNPIDPEKSLQTTISKKVTAESQVCENAADHHFRRM
jgi:hypothetical protein